MNVHAVLDRMVVAMGGLYGDALRFFREDAESPHVSQILDEVEAEVLRPTGPGEVSVPMRYRDEALESGYFVWQWAGPHAPAVLFHHGSGDYPYHSRIRKIASGNRKPSGVTIIATNIPFNVHGKMEYIRAVGRLENFALMLAGAARLIEGLVGELRDGGCGFVSVSGISLGGWITNLHKAYFDSADEYRPVFAGAAPDHLFRDTSYSKMAAAPARANPSAISRAINFENAFEARDNANVYPLLARHDQYVSLERQARIYRPDSLTVIDYGHVTGTMQNEALANHILAGVRKAASV